MKAFFAAFSFALGFAAVAHASPINGTGDVTPDIIFGSGNDNGGFTGQTANNIEVGLRGKQRYPSPANIFNYDGDHTYRFDPTVLTGPTNRSIFNFEFSINVDQNGTSGAVLSDFSYGISVDTNPGILATFTTVDPFATPLWFDHALGTNATANGGGYEPTDNTDLTANMSSYSVAQQSANLGFGWSGDPDAHGTYDFRLQVFSLGTSDVLSESFIQVVVTPVPAALPLLASAFGLIALVKRRRKA
ncbi:MAG: hypothetical protein ACJAWZ_004081 [Paracoccaceae bacterium]|jgi:hypothetical protein